MVAVMEQKNPSMEEEQHHYRFIPLTADNIYNCELCGVQIAVLQIVTSSTTNYQEEFKVCGTCLKEYIDRETAAKK
jgi:superfamily II helicase